MKKLVFCVLCVAFSFCSCSSLNVLTKAKPKIAVISDTSSALVLNEPMLSCNDKYLTEYIVTENADMIGKAQQFINSDLQLIVASTSTETQSRELAALAKSADIPLILLGVCPTNDTMDSFDKLWHIGASAKSGGEALGFSVGEYFKDNTVADTNADGILQIGFAGYDDSSIRDGVVQCAADLGVYSDISVANSSTTTEECYTATALLLADNSDIELIVSCGAANAKGASLAVSDADKSIPIMAVGDGAMLKALADDNKILAYSAYPDKDIINAATSFIDNILHGEAVINNTALRMSEHKTVLFPYGIVGK